MPQSTVEPVVLVPITPEETALRQKAAWGTVWTISFYGSSQALRLLSNILLTHLLAPQLFGLMALINTLLLGISLFSDIGLHVSVIQNERGDEREFLNTAWTVQVGRGVVLWLLTCALSWPLASFYSQPQLHALLPIMGVCLVISGFTSTSLLSLGRHMAVGTIAGIELLTQITQVVATLLWAWLSPSIWSLVGGKLIGDTARVILSHLYVRETKNQFAWDWHAARSLFALGKWTFFSTMLMFLASQSDRLILGRLVSLQTLGMYGIAFTLADLPRQIILMFSGRVGLPFIAKFSHLPRAAFRTMFLRYRGHVLVVMAFVLAVLINVSDLVFTKLYDSRYHGAAWMVPLLALGLWHTLLYSTSAPGLVAIGKLNYGAAGYLSTFLTLVIFLPLAYSFGGIRGAVALVAFSDLPYYVVTCYGQVREGMQSIRQDLLMTIVFLAFLMAGFLVRTSIGLPMPIQFAGH